MKKYIIPFALILAFSCEDTNDNDSESENNELVGLWEISNVGEYKNADCTGAIDNSGYVLLQLFGFKASMEFTSDGKGTYKVSGMGEDISMPVTWSGSKSEICLGGIECIQYKLNDSSFSFDMPSEGYCEDDDGNELSQYDESNCEDTSSRTWVDASCTINEFTKK